MAHLALAYGLQTQTNPFLPHVSPLPFERMIHFQTHRAL